MTKAPRSARGRALPRSLNEQVLGARWVTGFYDTCASSPTRPILSLPHNAIKKIKIGGGGYQAEDSMAPYRTPHASPASVTLPRFYQSHVVDFQAPRTGIKAIATLKSTIEQLSPRDNQVDLSPSAPDSAWSPCDTTASSFRPISERQRIVGIAPLRDSNSGLLSAKSSDDFLVEPCTSGGRGRGRCDRGTSRTCRTR